nr:unnamed protein product [Digitaria exilis]
MAGGGAAGSALSSPWRALLQRALDGNAHLRHSTYFQLATVGAGGWPANRTVVFRGFQEHCDKIQINTDARSNKVCCQRNVCADLVFFLTLLADLVLLGLLQICWYFTDSWEQFRISGIIDVIDGSSADPAKLQHREKAWFKSSVKSRLQYLGPQPGVPVVDDQQINDVHLDASAGPVDAFCLLVLDPEKVSQHFLPLCVDYLNLKNNQRLVFTRIQKEDGSSDWMAEKVSP